MITQALPLPADRDTLTTIVTVVLAFGGIGGLIALLRFRPEASKMAVETAQGAVVVAGQLLDDVLAELERQKAITADLRDRLSEFERTSASVDRLTTRVAQLEDERDELKDRVRNLETENIRLLEELSVVQTTQKEGNGT